MPSAPVRAIGAAGATSRIRADPGERCHWPVRRHFPDRCRRAPAARCPGASAARAPGPGEGGWGRVTDRAAPGHPAWFREGGSRRGADRLARGRLGTGAPPGTDVTPINHWLAFAASAVRAGMPDSDAPRAGLGRMFAHACAVTGLNPEGIVLFIVFVPQFLVPAEPFESPM